MEARLTGPPPAADSEREKKFLKGAYKGLLIKTGISNLRLRHKVFDTDLSVDDL